jgi:hypothetical protein
VTYLVDLTGGWIVNIQKVTISGKLSLGHVPDGMVDARVECIIAGEPHKFDMSFDISFIASFFKALWDELKGFLPLVYDMLQKNPEKAQKLRGIPNPWIGRRPPPDSDDKIRRGDVPDNFLPGREDGAIETEVIFENEGQEITVEVPSNELEEGTMVEEVIVDNY